jgi:hypothetical protein
MGRSKAKKMLSSTKGILRGIASKEGITNHNLDVFLSCPLVGEGAEVQLAFDAIAELAAGLSRKYREDFANVQFTLALKELERVVQCIKSNKVPK